MTALQSAIDAALPNLDSFVTPADAGAMRAELRDIAKHIGILASYCEAKENAMLCRMKGNIELALKFEAACDYCYKRLPEWARW